MWRMSSSGISGSAFNAATHSRYSLFSSSVRFLAILPSPDPEAVRLPHSRRRSSQTTRSSPRAGSSTLPPHSLASTGITSSAKICICSSISLAWKPPSSNQPRNVAHLHDRVDDVLLRAMDRDLPVAQHLRRHFLVEIEHRLIEPRHHGPEAERPVVIELQLNRPCGALQRLLLLAGAGDVEVAAGHDPAPLFGIPPELEPAAAQHVGEAGLFRRVVIDLDVAAQAVVRFGDHHAVDPVLGRKFEGAGTGQRLPQLRMRLLQRLREDL